MGPETNFWTCHQVSKRCPVEATVLGYYPDFRINTFLAAVFGLCMLGNVVTGIWKRTWAYSGFLAAGCGLELAGYVARTQLSNNPWNKVAFQTQICAIIIGPTVICISLYLTLKHITLAVDPSLSRLRPVLYPLVFVPADVSCLILQAIGGGLAAGARWDKTRWLINGNRLIIGGISLQCLVLGLFGSLCLDYYCRVKRRVKGKVRPETRAVWGDRRLRKFCYALLGAYIGIMIRCLYRIAEMARGWGNEIMRDEPSFIVLEGFMILIPVIVLALFPAGVFFPAMAKPRSDERRKNADEPKELDDSKTSVSRGPTLLNWPGLLL
ncbi:hypothetical protein DL770_003211 [Monosporascus sp. CRB-9-2]|nr:hypothetical protein DL770_003211 [Monosporascus sp. CRB-9-2]